MTSTTEPEPDRAPIAVRLVGVVAQADQARRDADDPLTCHRTRTNRRETAT